MEVAASKATDKAGVEVALALAIAIEEEKEKLNVVKMESSSSESESESDDDSGDETESEADIKPVGAPAPVLFESKDNSAKTTQGGHIKGESSSSSSDSDSDSDSSDDDEEEEEGDKSDVVKSDGKAATPLIESVIEVQVPEDGATDVPDIPKTVSKPVEPSTQVGGSDEQAVERSVTAFQLPSGDSSGDNDSDVEDVLKGTAPVNPVLDVASRDMPFTQEPSSYTQPADLGSPSDTSIIHCSADDHDNQSEDLAQLDKIQIDNGESIDSRSVAHSGQIEKIKSKTTHKESSVDVVPKVERKTLGDSDSDSSSSSDGDDSDEESSVNYQPAPKKPPLALMVRHHVYVCVSMYVFMYGRMYVCV